MAWLPTGLTAIVVCDHGSVKPTGVRAGAGRRGHLPATTAEVRATAMPKVHRHAQVRQCVERQASPAAGSVSAAHAGGSRVQALVGRHSWSRALLTIVHPRQLLQHPVVIAKVELLTPVDDWFGFR